MQSSSVLDREVPDLVATDGLDSVSAAEVDLAAGRADRWCGPSTSPGLRARAQVLQGDPAAARASLATIDPAAIGATMGAQELVSAAWAASRAGADPSLVTAMGDGLVQLERDRGEFATDQHVVLGPVSMFEALCAAAAGRSDSAVPLCRRSVAVADRRAPFWGAWARLELARLLAGSLDLLGDDTVGGDAAGDDTTSRRLVERERDSTLSGASLFFRSAGHRHMYARCEALGGEPEPADEARPGLGHLVRVAGADGRTSSWQVGMGTQPPVSVPHSLGLEAIAFVVANRHRSVPAVEVASHLDRDGVWSDMVAEHAHDAATLAAQIRDGRARSRVSKLIQRTIDGLAHPHSTLSVHLSQRLRTGYVCSYDDAATRWRT